MNVFICKYDHLGELMLSLPLVRALKETYVDLKLFFITKLEYISLIEKEIHVDGVFNNSAKSIKEICKKFNNNYILIDLHLTYIDEKCEEDMKQLKQNAFYYIGLSDDKKLKIKTDKNLIEDNIHASDLFFNLAKEKFKDISRKKNDHLMNIDEKKICIDEITSKLLAGFKNKKIAAIFPGGSNKYKCWGYEKYDVIIQHLVDREYNVLVILGKMEQDAIFRFKKYKEQVKLITDASLLELFCLFKKCEFLITNDSGPMHVAAASGLLTIGLHGHSDYKKWGAIGEKNVYITANTSCSPCNLEFCKLGTSICMESITTESVIDAIFKVEGKRL